MTVVGQAVAGGLEEKRGSSDGSEEGGVGGGEFLQRAQVERRGVIAFETRIPGHTAPRWSARARFRVVEIGAGDDLAITGVVSVWGGSR